MDAAGRQLIGKIGATEEIRTQSVTSVPKDIEFVLCIIHLLTWADCHETPQLPGTPGESLPLRQTLTIPPEPAGMVLPGANDLAVRRQTMSNSGPVRARTRPADLRMRADRTIPCFLINLNRSTARLDHMRRVLGGAGIAFERYEAVEADRVHEHPLYSRIPKLRSPRDWARAEVACLLSHYGAWTRIVAGDEPFGAVFEDDLHIDSRMREVLVASCMPPDADLVKLETVNTPVGIARRQDLGPSGLHFARLYTLHHGGGAYILSRAAAQRAIESIDLFDLPVDDVLFSPKHPVGRTMRCYQVVPAVAMQDVILPVDRRSPALSSVVEPSRVASKRGMPVPEVEPAARNRLLPLHNLPFRMVRSLWRRTIWRIETIPFRPQNGAGPKP